MEEEQHNGRKKQRERNNVKLLLPMTLIMFLLLISGWNNETSMMKIMNQLFSLREDGQVLIQSIASTTDAAANRSSLSLGAISDIPSRIENNESGDNTEAMAVPPPCTYLQLEQAFACRQKTTGGDSSSNNINNNKNQNEPNSDTDTDCWQLKDELLQIPVTSIWNRNSMTQLGHGKNGSVFKGIVNLKTTMNTKEQKESTTSSSSFCSVAVKTERCCRVNKFPKSIVPRRIQPWMFHQDCSSSCIIASVATYPFRMTWKRSRDKENHLRSEYTGALLFASSKKTRKVGGFVEERDELLSSGMLPTWAVIVPDEKDEAKIHKESNGDDPFLVGVIMPLQPPTFVTVEKILTAIPTTTTKSSETTMTRQEQKQHNGNKTGSPSLSSSSSSSSSSTAAAELAQEKASEEMAKIMLPAATALQFAHRLGIIQQDLFEGNIAILPNTAALNNNGDDNNNKCPREQDALSFLLQAAQQQQQQDNNIKNSGDENSDSLSLSSCFHAMLYDFTFTSFVEGVECRPLFEIRQQLDSTATDVTNDNNEDKEIAAAAAAACQFCRDDSDFSYFQRKNYFRPDAFDSQRRPSQPTSLSTTVKTATATHKTVDYLSSLKTETKRFIYLILIPFWNMLRILLTVEATTAFTGDLPENGHDSHDDYYLDSISSAFAQKTGLDSCSSMDQVVNALQNMLKNNN